MSIETSIRNQQSRLGPNRYLVAGLGIAFALLLTISAPAQRFMENLGRGVVAVRSSSSQVFISWRLLGLDPAGIAFNVYRSANGGPAVKLNSTPLTGGCNYTDTTANLTLTNAYHVRPVLGGVEQSPSASYTLPANTPTRPLFSIPLQPLPDHYIHLAWVGDLDGDGEYDFVVNRLGTVGGQTQKLEAYKRDGTFLWRADFGPNSIDPDGVYPTSAAIDAGQWDGVTVYDLDSDGFAEVIVKSANGVTFGDGTTLTHGNNLTQFLSVLDGMTGAEKARIVLPNPWPSSGPLGVLFGIGYPDGTRPSLMIHAKNRVGGSGTPFNVIQSAWDYRGGILSNRWSIQWNASVAPPVAHQMRIVDVDGDGQDDLVPGMHVVSSGGTLLYNLGNQGVVHGDRFHIGDLDPNRPGLEGYGIQQANGNGLTEYFYDAATGQILWTVVLGPPGPDAARGTAADVNPDHPGYEVWSFYGMRTATGTQLTSDPNRPWPNFRIWWDGDVRSENLNRELVEKWNPVTLGTSRLLTGWDYGAVDTWRDAPPFYGDIIGDWREEIIFEKSDHTELLIFTTTTPSNIRLYTLPHNPAYRNGMSVKGYLQSHLVDYYLGEGMITPPAPNITYVLTGPPPPAPPAPMSLTATTISASRIDLAWTDTATNETSFLIERSLNGVDFSQVASVGADVASYADVGLLGDTLYYYRLRASNAGGASDYSNVASDTTLIASEMIKADTATMHTAADWSGVTPASSEIGLFNNVLSAGNAAALTLGGDVTLGGLIFANNLNGPVTVAAGNTLTLGEAGLDLNAANQNLTLHAALSLAGAQSWNINSGRALTVNGALTSANYTVIKTGGGTLLLGITTHDAGANVQVNEGVVQANASSGILISLNGGTFNVNVFDSNPIHVMAGGGTEQNVGGNRTWAGNLTGSGPLTVNAASTHTWSGNNSAYTGTITLQGGGTLRLSSLNAVSATTAYHFNSGTMSANASGTFQLGSLSGVGSIFGGAGQNYSLGALNADADFSGAISGSTALIKTGSGVQTLSGANAFSGGLQVNSGTVKIGNGGTTGAPGTGDIANQATLVFHRSDVVPDSGFGVISGAGMLVQRGAGVLTLTKAHPYTGATILEAGTLALTGPGAIADSASITLGLDTLLDVSGRVDGAMTLGSGKVLRGSGAVRGNFTIGTGATLQPGESIGTLTFSNALALAAGSTNVFEASAGPLDYDRVQVLGPLTCGGALVVTNLGSEPFAVGNTLQLFTAGSYSGHFQAVHLPTLPASLAWNTNLLTSSGIISVVSTAPPTPPVFGSVALVNGALVLGGTGGVANANYYLLGSSNLSLPLNTWERLLTNQFDASGAFAITNPPNQYWRDGFYRLEVP
jgi:rhamnogalacturonan endolyase